jgi:hypothetical protein
MNSDVNTFIPDTTDVGVDSDVAALTGMQIYFDMNINPTDILRLAGSPRPQLIKPQRITGTIGSDGRMVDAQTNVGVRLMANDPALNLSTPLTYHVSGSKVVLQNGKKWTFAPFNIPAPDVDTTVDLADFTPVPGTTVIGIPDLANVDDLTDMTTIGKAVARAVSQAAARTAIGVDVIAEFYDNLAAFPGTGDVSQEYVAEDTGKIYRWNGSAYVELSAGLPPNIFTTKGDLITATGASAVVRLGAGANRSVLKADSTQTNGLRWAAAPTFHVDDFGADPTGTAFSDTAVAAAITAMGTSPGILEFGGGGSTYKLNNTMTLAYPGQGIRGQGAGFVRPSGGMGPGHALTAIDWRGTGDCFRVWDSIVPTNGSTGPGVAGPITGLYVHAWNNANTNINGLNIGDLWGIHIDDVVIEGFATAGATGYLEEPLYTWCERAYVHMSVNLCTTGYRIKNGPSSAFAAGSADYSNYILSVWCNANQNGFVLDHMVMAGANFTLFGNCSAGVSNTGVFLTVGTTGTDPSLIRGAINIQAEMNGTGVGHTDINIGAVANIIGTGIVNLVNTSASFVAGTATANNLLVNGLVSTAGIVNSLQPFNSGAGVSPSFQARGSDTNLHVIFVPKGTGSFYIYEAAGQTVAQLQAAGTATNINLNLIAQGTGVVEANGVQIVDLSTAQTLTSKTLTSPKIAQIIDTNGNPVLALNPTASAVNYWALSNNAAGQNPFLSVQGTDTNIGIFFIPKGTGKLFIYEATGQTVATIAAAGTASNVDLNLTTQGTGTVQANGVRIVDLTSSQALTNKDLTGAGNTFPTFNQNTTGSAAKLTTARAINGVNFDGTAPITIADATKQPVLAEVVKQTTNYTATANQLVPMDATSGVITHIFPTAPPDGTRQVVKKIDSSSNAVNLALGGSDVFNIAAGPTTGSLVLQNQAIQAQYDATHAIWYVISTDVPLSGLDGRYVQPTQTVALTNKDLTSGTNTFPTLNQNTTGSAAKWTTARNLAGNSVDGSANVNFANKFIAQGTSDAGLSSAQFLGALSTGLVTNTTTTGVLGSVPAPTGAVVGTTDTQALTNKNLTDATNTLSPANVGAYWLPVTPYAANNYYYFNSPHASATGVVAVTTVRVTPAVITSSVTIIGVFAEFTAAGSSDSTYRIGIWADNGSYKPTTLVLDCGSISTGSGNAGTVATGGTPGVYEITGLSQVLAPGLYWVGGVAQGTTAATVRGPTQAFSVGAIALGTSLPGAGGVAHIYTAGNSMSGALASITSPVAGAGTAPARIGFHVHT